MTSIENPTLVPVAAPARRRTTPVSYTPNDTPAHNEVDMSHIDAMLSREMTFAQTESWSKLSPYTRTSLLHAFADEHSATHNLNADELAALKELLSDSVSRGKLKRVKDVNYDQPARVVRAIPALTFDDTARIYSLRNMDPARVSTLKSLTPKRITTLKHT
jgi:hypothetical protein